jgi:hypothetical protein
VRIDHQASQMPGHLLGKARPFLEPHILSLEHPDARTTIAYLDGMITTANHRRIHMHAHAFIVAQNFRLARARSFIAIERAAVYARPRKAALQIVGGTLEERIEAGGDVS